MGRSSKFAFSSFGRSSSSEQNEYKSDPIAEKEWSKLSKAEQVLGVQDTTPVKAHKKWPAALDPRLRMQKKSSNMSLNNQYSIKNLWPSSGRNSREHNRNEDSASIRSIIASGPQSSNIQTTIVRTASVSTAGSRHNSMTKHPYTAHGTPTAPSYPMGAYYDHAPLTSPLPNGRFKSFSRPLNHNNDDNNNNNNNKHSPPYKSPLSVPSRSPPITPKERTAFPKSILRSPSTISVNSDSNPSIASSRTRWGVHRASKLSNAPTAIGEDPEEYANKRKVRISDERPSVGPSLKSDGVSTTTTTTKTYSSAGFHDWLADDNDNDDEDDYLASPPLIRADSPVLDANLLSPILPPDSRRSSASSVRTLTSEVSGPDDPPIIGAKKQRALKKRAEKREQVTKEVETQLAAQVQYSGPTPKREKRNSGRDRHMQSVLSFSSSEDESEDDPPNYDMIPPRISSKNVTAAPPVALRIVSPQPRRSIGPIAEGHPMYEAANATVTNLLNGAPSPDLAEKPSLRRFASDSTTDERPSAIYVAEAQPALSAKASLVDNGLVRGHRPSRSRVMVVTEEEERLLEVMREKRASIRTATLVEGFKQVINQKAAKNAVPQRPKTAETEASSANLNPDYMQFPVPPRSRANSASNLLQDQLTPKAKTTDDLLNEELAEMPGCAPPTTQSRNIHPFNASLASSALGSAPSDTMPSPTASQLSASSPRTPPPEAVNTLSVYSSDYVVSPMADVVKGHRTHIRQRTGSGAMNYEDSVDDRRSSRGDTMLGMGSLGHWSNGTNRI